MADDCECAAAGETGWPDILAKGDKYMSRTDEIEVLRSAETIAYIYGDTETARRLRQLMEELEPLTDLYEEASAPVTQ
jgi:hypothetical protein